MKILSAFLMVLVLAFPAFAANVPSLSGGVGEEEQQRIEQAQSQYNLKALFATTNGDYLSDVEYTVRLGGDVFTHGISKGPYLLLKLPAGTYIFTAAHGGQSKAQRVTVADMGLKKLDFRFAE